MHDNLIELKELLERKSTDKIPLQTEWIRVKSVNWQDKTMIGVNEDNGLDYDDILLGIGSMHIKPKQDSLAIIGLIANSSSSFLIYAEEVEEFEWLTGQSSYNIKENGFEIKKENETLKSVLNDFIDEVNKIIVIQGTSINVPAVEAIKQRLNTILI